jgi:hypothetical protein
VVKYLALGLPLVSRNIVAQASLVEMQSKAMLQMAVGESLVYHSTLPYYVEIRTLMQDSSDWV